ncbi:MAG: hypothetical protein RR548_04980 [Carnobacterium sp.]|uniref:hypothetical protein n=1 Tax=Carnobacterium sp. TaxID=48221 RepID=UPI002FC8F860
MAKHINLDSKLSSEKPTVTIGDLTLKVNDEKSNILKMNSVMKNSTDLTEIEMIDKSLELLIGKKSMQELEKLKISFSEYKKVYMAVIAVVNDQELSEVEENFRKNSQ